MATVTGITPGATQTGDPSRYCALIGTGFTGTCSVSVGGVPATEVTVINTTRVTFYAPVSSAGGARDVVFTNGDGQIITKPNFFTYRATSVIQPHVWPIKIVRETDWDVLGAAACGEGVTYVPGSGAPGVGNDDRAFGTFTDLLQAGLSFTVAATQASAGSDVYTYCKQGGWDRGFVISTGDVIKLRDHQTAVATAGYEQFVSTDFAPAEFGSGGAPGDLIEFTLQFVPTYPMLVIPFVFSTEEIPNFVSFGFNDQVSVKIDGVEIAYFPDGVTRISVDQYATLSAQYFFTTGRISGLLNGNVALYLLRFVTPGRTYTLDVRIQDIGDGILDSAAFIGDMFTLDPPATTPPPTGTPSSGHDRCGCTTDFMCLLCDFFPRTTPTDYEHFVDEYRAFVGTDTRIFGYSGVGSVDDDEIYQAYVKTKAFQPGGDLAHQGEVAHTAQPLLIARPETDSTVYLDIIRDLEAETQQTSVTLTPVSTERRVIRKYESAAMGDATEVQFQLGDRAPIASTWDLHLFSVRLTPGGMK